MAKGEASCPVCNADVPLGGDEQPGDEISCVYCGAPCRLAGKSQDEPSLEEDF
jgi:hypothetical protein